MIALTVGSARFLEGALQTESKKVDASISPLGGYGNMVVLIVERDPMVAEVLADALADAGIRADYHCRLA